MTRYDYIQEFMQNNEFDIDWSFSEITHVVLEDGNTDDAFILSAMDGLSKTISEGAKILRFLGWLLLIRDNND